MSIDTRLDLIGHTPLTELASNPSKLKSSSRNSIHKPQMSVVGGSIPVPIQGFVLARAQGIYVLEVEQVGSQSQ